MKKIIGIRLLNAFVVALITFISTLSIQYPPSLQNIWAGFIAFSLTLLTQIRALLNDLSKQKNKKEENKEKFMLII